MSFRRVVALSEDHVAMCFSRADGAACKVAAGFAQHPTAAPEGAAISAASLSSLSSPLAWGEPRFLDSARPTGRIEVERLGSDRFVVCFERLPAGAAQGAPVPAVGKMVVCSLGLVETAGAESGSSILLQPFEEALELGAGKLVAVSVLEAGRRFAVCHHVEDGHNGEVVAAAGTPAAAVAPGIGVLAHMHGRATSCRWAEVALQEGGGSGGGPSLQWTDDVALEVFRQDDGPV